MEYIEEIQERVILVGVQLDENDNVKESLDGRYSWRSDRWQDHPEP